MPELLLPDARQSSLIAQGLCEPLVFITMDGTLKGYSELVEVLTGHRHCG